MPHFARKENDRISFNNLLNEVAAKRGASSYRDASQPTQHEIRIEAAQIYRPRYRDNKNSDYKDKSQYQTNADFKIQDGKIIYTGAYDGISAVQLNINTKRDTPDQYNPNDLLLTLIAQEALAEKSTKVILIHPLDGQDNRDITILDYDPKTNTGKTSIINTAPDGKHHTFEEMMIIVKEHFPELNIINPTDHVVVLTDKIIPQEKIERVIQEFGIREQGLEIKEQKMRFDVEKGKVFTKDEEGRNIDIENLAESQLERKQKHRLVGKIKSCQACAARTEKPEAFFYAPDNLGDDKKERTVSQIVVDPKGDVTFKTIALSKETEDKNLKKILLKLGYPGKSPTREFTYTDNPVPDAEMKKIVTEELTPLQQRNKFEFLSLRVFPIVDRLDFLREGLNTDRIITNNPPLYFHDIAVIKRSTNEKSARATNNLLQALVVINSNETAHQEIRSKQIGKKLRVPLFDGEESGEPDRNPNQGGAGEAITDPYRESQTLTRKSKRHQNSRSDNDGDASPPTVNLYLDKQEDDIESKRRKNENGKTTPKIPAPQTPSKVHFEKEVIYQHQYLVIDSIQKSPPSSGTAPESFPARSPTTIISPLFQIDHMEYVEHIEIKREIKVEQPKDQTYQSEKKVKQSEEKIDRKKIERTVNTKLISENKEAPIAGKAAGKKATTETIGSDPKTNIRQPETKQAKNEGDSIQVNTELQKISDILIFPTIINPSPIGARVDVEKVQTEAIWEIFLHLYFAVMTRTEFEIRQEKKKRMLIVAEQEIKTGANFFTAQQFGNYTRILAILFICILTFSRGI